MSFLTPLYLLGALAVGLPILFHLIRRTPRGRQLFSSVMFLAPSPPRITRRSRIEHWLLLALRALAICLLAAAFARPFLREQSAADATDGTGRWIAVLLDTSASMRRGELWGEAVARLEDLLESAGPHDRVALYTFDDRLQERFSWEAWAALEPEQRTAAAQAAVSGVSPNWRGTDLGRALVTIADSLEDVAGAEREPAPREIVVVSDLASGCRLEALQNFDWPEGVPVRLERLGADLDPTNAGLHVSSDAAAGDAALRVRVTSAADSRREQFRVRWGDEFGQSTSTGTRHDGGNADAAPTSEPEADQTTLAAAPAADALEVYVPPGQSRVVRAPEAAPGPTASRLLLEGDAHDFDNTCYVARRLVRDVTIVYLGGDDPTDATQYRYFVEPLFPSAKSRTVRVLDWDFESPSLPESATGLQMVLLTEPPRPDQVAALRTYLEAGGLVVFVPRNPDDCAAIYELAGVAPQPAAEAEIDSYAMVGEVDFAHPIFAPLADPRFSDFTRLHFWKHRRIDTDALPGCRVLARLDSGDVLLGEVPRGQGRLVFFSSGWNRADSQLAVWSKFVPLMNGLLEYGSGQLERPAQFVVGQEIDLSLLAGPRDVFTSLRRPGGEALPLTLEAAALTDIETPGVYTLSSTSSGAPLEVRFAVNAPPAESRTDPLPLEALEAAGILLAAGDSATSRQVAAERERQLQNRELEGRQKLWRWLIVAAVVILLVETLLAGRLATGKRELSQ